MLIDLRPAPVAVAAFGVDVELEITSVELSSAETCFSVWG